MTSVSKIRYSPQAWKLGCTSKQKTNHKAPLCLQNHVDFETTDQKCFKEDTEYETDIARDDVGGRVFGVFW